MLAQLTVSGKGEQVALAALVGCNLVQACHVGCQGVARADAGGGQHGLGFYDVDHSIWRSRFEGYVLQSDGLLTEIFHLDFRKRGGSNGTDLGGRGKRYTCHT